MTKKKPLYDVECLHLAEHFFRDHPLGTDENVEELAALLQRTIEEHIAFKEEDGDK